LYSKLTLLLLIITSFPTYITLLVSVNLSMRKKLLRLALGRSQGVSGAREEVLDDGRGNGGEYCTGVVDSDGLGERDGVDEWVLGCLCSMSAPAQRSEVLREIMDAQMG
jgi:hypothetical protein